MTADDFRSLALSLPEAAESAHMGHPDFRVRNKIFATLAPGEVRGMVKLTPDQQASFAGTEPDVFQPVNGASGSARRHLRPPGSGRRADRPAGPRRRVAEHGSEAAGPTVRRRTAHLVPVRIMAATRPAPDHGNRLP